jgi:hypothetical protein
MVMRMTPQQFFDDPSDDKTWIIVGIIVVGIVACVALATIAKK